MDANVKYVTMINIKEKINEYEITKEEFSKLNYKDDNERFHRRQLLTIAIRFRILIPEKIKYSKMFVFYEIQEQLINKI